MHTMYLYAVILLFHGLSPIMSLPFWVFSDLTDDGSLTTSDADCLSQLLSLPLLSLSSDFQSDEMGEIQQAFM